MHTPRSDDMDMLELEQLLSEAWAARELAQMRADNAQSMTEKMHHLDDVARWDIIRQSLYAQLDALKGQRRNGRQQP